MSSFAVDVEVRMDAWGKMGTAYLSRFLVPCKEDAAKTLSWRCHPALANRSKATYTTPLSLLYGEKMAAYPWEDQSPSLP